MNAQITHLASLKSALSTGGLSVPKWARGQGQFSKIGEEQSLTTVKYLVSPRNKVNNRWSTLTPSCDANFFTQQRAASLAISHWITNVRSGFLLFFFLAQFTKAHLKFPWIYRQKLIGSVLCLSWTDDYFIP